MRREHVESSSLSSVGYDPRHHLLEVEFRNGGVYQYRNVPATEWEALQHADSMGRYVNFRIKPKYPCERLRDPN